MSLAVSTEKLTKIYAGTAVVDHVSLNIKSGESVALLGPNGAGKTTFLEMLEGITLPSSGKLQIYGHEHETASQKIKKLIGLSFQETHFFDRQTVSETISLFSAFYNLDENTVNETMNIFGLASFSDKYTMHLSGGQRQRMSLAIAMAHNPKILFLDEPTTGLDPLAREQLWQLIRKLLDRGLTLLLTTHYMEEAESLCDRVIMLNRGKILADGSVPELLSTLPGKDCVEFKFKDSIPRRSLERLAGLRALEIDQEKKKVIMDVDEASNTVPALLLDKDVSPIRDLSIRKRNLNDVFLHLTGKGLRSE